jgi:hypothetical protein
MYRFKLKSLLGKEPIYKGSDAEARLFTLTRNIVGLYRW